ncbi:hypothetical protein ACFLYY_02375, partial [Patescibacteria group bacterium]
VFPNIVERNPAAFQENKMEAHANAEEMKRIIFRQVRKGLGSFLIKIVSFVFLFRLMLVLSLIMSQLVGLAVYKILAVPASFHIVWKWTWIIFPDPKAYISGTAGGEHLIPVCLFAGLITLVIFLIAWRLIRKIKSNWRFLLEPTLLIVAQYQFFVAMFVLSDEYIPNLLFVSIPILVLSIVIIPAYIFFHYWERIGNWMIPQNNK